MTFLTPPNFRQLPRVWEIAQPFQIGGDTSAIQGPIGMPALNWAPGQPSGEWDPGVDYQVGDVVLYNTMVWTTSAEVTGIPPLQPLTDGDGNLITDINGDPIYPWSSVVNWNAATVYNPNDAVIYMNHSWMCTIQNSGVPPGTSPVDGNGVPITDPSTGGPLLPWQLLPVKLGVGGGVAYDTDPASWARNHILALLLTNPGERVMRPTYGTGLRAFIFENNDPFVEQTMATSIRQSLQSWEPNITINDVSMSPDPFNVGRANVDVHFSVGSSPTVHSVTFSLGGTGIEVMA